MEFLDSCPAVRSWTKRHRIRIYYHDGKKRRKYIPDFLVERHDGRLCLEETKGYVFDKLKYARKNAAALVYCAARGMTFRILREEDLESEP